MAHGVKKFISSRHNDTIDSPTKFTWEGANDNKLLLLTQGRYVKTEEYAQLASAFSGVTVGSIRNRISALRIKQRNLYEEMGWQVPEGGAGYSAKKKRSAEGGEEGTPSKKPRTEQGEDTPTPAKKPRAKKGAAKIVEEGIQGEEVGQSVDEEIKPWNGVKEEQFEDEEI